MNAGAALTMYVMGATMVLAFVLAVVPLPTSLRRLPEFTGIAGIVATLAITVAQWGERQVAFYGELRIDRFGLLMTWIIMLSALATIALAWGEPAAARAAQAVAAPPSVRRGFADAHAHARGCAGL